MMPLELRPPSPVALLVFLALACSTNETAPKPPAAGSSSDAGSSGQGGRAGTSSPGVSGASGGRAGASGGRAGASGGRAGGAGSSGAAGSFGAAGSSGAAGTTGASGSSAPACPVGMHMCDDGCAAASVGFESGTVEGLYLEPNNSRAALGEPTAASIDGMNAARVDVHMEGSNTSIMAFIDPCTSHTDLYAKTLSARVLLEGPPLPGTGTHSLSIRVQTTTTSWSIGRVENPSVGSWHTVRGVVNAPSGMASLSFGPWVFVRTEEGSWEGSVYIDDVQIE